MNRLFRNSIGYGAYGENFGDGVPPACASAAQAVGDAGVEMQQANAPGPSGFPDPNRIANANLNLANKQQALQSCITSNSGITAGDVATGFQTGVGVASMFAPLAMMFMKKPQPPTRQPGQPIIMQAPAPNNTPIIIAAVAGVAVLLVVVMMMQKK